MKLVLATPLYPPEIGGPATYAKALVDGLPARGIEVELVKFSDVRGLPKLVRHFAYYRRVLRAARGADAVLALDPVSVGLPAMHAAKKAGKAFVVKIVGDYAWEQGRQRFGVSETLDDFVKTRQTNFFVRVLQKIQTRVAAAATRVLVPSEYLKGIVAAWGVESKKVTVIHNGIELPTVLPEIARPEGFLVVSSGRRVPWKNFEGIERAVSRENAWHLHIASGVSRTEALAWVKAADVYVLNSTYEGLPHALIEAMLLGTPVVATSAGGNSELVEDGVTGLLVPVADDEALYAALKKIESEPEAAKARAAEGRTRMQDFSVPVMLDATAAFLTHMDDFVSRPSKVLMVSGDPNLLIHGSEARERHALQAGAVERLDVFVWPQVHSYAQIARAAHATKYDVLTAQDPFWRGLIAWRLARAAGARLNLQLHADLAGQSFIKRALAQFLLKRADSIRVVSERVANEVRVLRVKACITVLPVFVDLARVAHVEPVPHEGKAILWIGRFEKEKDPLRAIAVFKEVRAKVPDAKLVMLGKGLLAAALRAAAHGLPVEFPGWQDPRAFLAQADVVLSTSPYESFGASIVEALAAGVPVVSLDVGVAREAGAVVVSTADELAPAIARVLLEGTRGELKLKLLSAPDWARAWRESL